LLKKISYIIIFCLLNTVVFSVSISECKRLDQKISDLPCTVYTPYLPASNCSNVSVTIYDAQNQNVTTTQFIQDTLNCHFQINPGYIAPKEIYFYNSTLLSGSITFEEDNLIAIIVMFGIIIFALCLIIFLVNVPIIKIISILLGLLELIMMMGILFINESGESVINLLKLNFWIILIYVFGLIFIYGYSWHLKVGDMQNNNPDGDIKWVK